MTRAGQIATFEQSFTAAQLHPPRRVSSRGIKLRIFLTCWLVYVLHYSPYVYRELYLTMSLAEKHTIHVDDYVGLHPDLFILAGRGSFLGHNPGTSILAAIPYWISLPLVNRIAPVRPPTPGQNVSAEYKTPHADRQQFYEKVRARGLDLHLAAAATVTACLFMAPLTALGAVVMFGLLQRFGFALKISIWLSLLYAFGTPVFFRTATLSLNLVVALLGLFAFAVMLDSQNAPSRQLRPRYFLAGLIAGYSVVTDYTGLVTVGALTLFAITIHAQRGLYWPSLKSALWFVLGTVGPIAFMLGWQWYCYGSPWLAAQHVMPKQFFMGYPSERGVGWPLPEALWGLLFDPMYGLFVFAPLFFLAFCHFLLIRRRENLVPWRVALITWVFFATLWVFCSCIHYTIRWQWQDGIRYMVPIVPFLYLLVADVLTRIPRGLAYLVALAAVVETWCLAMVRENPLESVARVLLHGFELPWLTTLTRTANQYFPALAEGASPIPLFVLFGVLVWGIWTIRYPAAPLGRRDAGAPLCAGEE